MSSTDPAAPAAKMTVRGVEDILALVPYLLRHHPTDSIVVVVIRAAKVVLAARGDLPAAGTTPAKLRACVEYLAAVAAAQDASAAFVIGYGPAGQVDALIADVPDAFAARGIQLHDVLRITDGRYFSYQCTDPLCCPPDGTPFDVTGSVVAATATVAGLVALPDHAAVHAQVAPLDDPARTAMRHAVQRAHDRRTALTTAATAATAEPSNAGPGPAPTGEQEHAGCTVSPIDACIRQAGGAAIEQAFDRYEHGGRLDDDEAAWLTVLLTHLDVRDAAWARTSNRDAHLQLWLDLTRRAATELVPAPASLLTFAAWQSGNGALARAALQRALAVAPSYSMARLLAEILRRGVAPSALNDRPVPARPHGDPPTGRH